MISRSTTVFRALFMLMASLAGLTSALAQRDLTSAKSFLFSGPGNCTMCHQSNGTANTTAAGKDVSQPTLWRSTIMANAARDPFWQAMVVAEMRALPLLADAIQSKCTGCHTPMGHEEAERTGKPAYTLSEAVADPLAMDGVSCTLCHQITSENLGSRESFSGEYKISPTRVTFGPVQNPLVNPMQPVSGFTPVYAEHMGKSEFCATCHTLFTPYVDKSGTITGEFPEQTPFLEWRASAHRAENRHCQSCHVPAWTESIPLSTLPPSAPARTPYILHHFVGGNAYMLRMLKAHGGELLVTARDEHFDSTIALTRNQLKERAVVLSGRALMRNDTLDVRVRVVNTAGHKFPTGFPSRRAWLHIVVRDNTNAMVFESGAWREDGSIIGEDAALEPHHAIITADDQVQVSESVGGDVESVPTYQLLRMARRLKDNRIPPRGFPDEAMRNDTISVVGVPAGDTDFNNADGIVGSGSDDVIYSVRVDPAKMPYHASVQLVYQSVNPRFVDSFSAFTDSTVARFLRLYGDADNSPELLREMVLSTDVSDVDGVTDTEHWGIDPGFPQPIVLSKHRVFHIPMRLQVPGRPVTVELCTVLGALLSSVEYRPNGSDAMTVGVPVGDLSPGVYAVRIRNGSHAASLPLFVMP